MDEISGTKSDFSWWILTDGYFVSMDGVELSENNSNSTVSESITKSVHISHDLEQQIFHLFNNKLYVVFIHYHLVHVTEEK